ncbi:MAG: molybdopterin-dependent oxidoreductase, partial [Vicinamibacterales bacterium]
FNEQGVHSLLSGNLMDVCPVGAITTRQYRFRSRPWDNPHAVDTTCTLCAKGCSTTAWLKAKPEWAKGARLARMTPRYNPQVNDYWMCDIGRFQYLWVEGEQRLRKPLLNTRQGVHSLLSGNLMDVCPVGAITTRQYRFRSRPWDNPHAVDTTCTLCAKGCSTTAWLKAKPEWARGARLARMTPRYNGQVNDFWMCDIGRFQYLWVEGEQRLRKPLINTKEGVQQVVTWKDALMRVRDVLNAAGRKDPASVRILVSAHASHEEMFLVKRLAEDLKGDSGASHVHVGWRRSEKAQPANTRFRVPSIDAPNVNGATDLGLAATAKADGDADLSALRAAIDQGRVSVLYVLDPGPDGSMGDLSWLVEARKNGRVPVIVYQGVLQTELAKIADVVLPGAAWVEKDATYTNEKGLVQTASKAINAPGESVEDWQILTSVAASLGLPYTYTTSQQVRADVAQRLSGRPEYADLGEARFNQVVSAEHWLKTSNPMERWKWDTMFQDLPPVKGHNVQMEQMSQPTVIPLRLVTEEISRASE